MRWWDGQQWTTYAYREVNRAGKMFTDVGGAQRAVAGKGELLPSGAVPGDHWSHDSKKRWKRRRWGRPIPFLLAAAVISVGALVVYQTLPA